MAFPPADRSEKARDGFSDRSRRLALAKLRTATGTTEAVLLSLLHAAVTSQQTVVAKRFGQSGIESLERPGDAQPTGSCLPRRATTIDGDAHIHFGLLANLLESSCHEHPILDRGEIGLEFSAVDGDRARSGTKPHAGNGCLATTGGNDVLGICCSCHGLIFLLLHAHAQRLRSLGLVGMFGAGVNFQFVEHHPSEAGFRQHAADRLMQDQFRPAITTVLRGL